MWRCDPASRLESALPRMSVRATAKWGLRFGTRDAQRSVGGFVFFFRFDSKTWIIIFAWVNDENTLRSSGSKSDPYTVFQRMLERGHPPDDSPPDALVSWEALGDERDERHGRFLPQPPRPHDRVAPRVGPVTPPHLFTSARRWVKKPWKRCFSKPSMWPSP